MKQTPLVSIITPFKDTEKYISECLESILAQTYKNWELLCVNDHSTDASNQIVKDFSIRDNRIKLFQNIGDGLIPGIREGYKRAKGKLITRMDSDDIMSPDRLENMSQDLLKSGHGHVALGKVKYFSENGVNDGYLKYEKWLNSLTSKGSNFTEIYKECVIPSPCWMMFREDFETCGRFDPDKYPEDYDLAFRMYKNKMKCIPSNSILHYWRDHQQRSSRTLQHYADNYFLEIKYTNFIELDYDKSRALTLWGAGKKGKTIAKKLIEDNIHFYWLCDNPKKIGKDIYGKVLLNYKELKNMEKPQSIVMVANKKSQSEIKDYFKIQTMRPMLDYFFFC